MHKLATALTAILLVGHAAPVTAEPESLPAEEAIRKIAESLRTKPVDEESKRFCSAWRKLEPGMPFREAEALGIEMNGSCTPGEPQSFHQPYMDLYFDSECRAVHGATTLDC